MCNRLIYFSLQNPFWGLDLLNKVTWMWLVGLIVFQCSSSLDPYVPFWSSKPEQKQAVYWSLKVRRIRLLKHFFSLKQTDLFQLKPIEPIKKSHSIEQELQWEAQTVSFIKIHTNSSYNTLSIHNKFFNIKVNCLQRHLWTGKQKKLFKVEKIRERGKNCHTSISSYIKENFQSFAYTS